MPAAAPPSCAAHRAACVRQQATASSKSPTTANDSAVSRTGIQSSAASSARTGRPKPARDSASGDASTPGTGPLHSSASSAAARYSTAPAGPGSTTNQNTTANTCRYASTRPRSIARRAISELPRSAAEPPRHAASARRAAGRSAAASAATIAEIAWLKRRNPMRKYRTTTLTARPSPQCTASASHHASVAASTGGATAATAAKAPCWRVPSLSRRSSERA